MKLSCIIVDDEPLALDLLEEYVHRTPFLELKVRCTSGSDALDILSTQTVDLAFLDIQMPQLSGLELSRLVPKRTRIIFTTAFEQYALEGFKVDALDYLLKPFNYTEFGKAASKAYEWFEMLRGNAQLNQGQPRTLIAKADYKQYILPLDDILYIKGEKDYVQIVTDVQTVKSLKSMRSVEEMLPSDSFVRVHRSYIINVDKVQSVGRMQVTIGDTQIPVSDSCKDDFMRMLAKRSLK